MDSFIDTTLQHGNFGYVDIESTEQGLISTKVDNKTITVNSTKLFLNSKNCAVSGKVLSYNQTLALNGYNLRGPYYEKITAIESFEGNVSAVIKVSYNDLTTDIYQHLKIGDMVNISGVNKLNGLYKIIKFVPVGSTSSGIVINKPYKDIYKQNNDSLLMRNLDYGYPQIKNSDSVMDFNKLIFKLNRKLWGIKKLSLIYISIPRDIISLDNYFTDYKDYAFSTPRSENGYNEYINYKSFIIPDPVFVEEISKGFFNTPIDFLRSYTYGVRAPPNQYTPPPQNLWNPPQGEWPTGQPPPYPFQTVPTYVSKEALLEYNGVTNEYYLVCGGYGIYNLDDFTFTTGGSEDVNRSLTAIVRLFLLNCILPSQSLHGVKVFDFAQDIPLTGIWDPETKTFKEASQAEFFGYGVLQQFVPGPGIGTAYQPTGDPTIITDKNPIPFPLFRGNVWGPYDSPGDRFQKLGLRETIQDLFLNSDLRNLKGADIFDYYQLFQEVQSGNFINLDEMISVTTGNINYTTNPNILNAMRLMPNGFGAIAQKIKEPIEPIEPTDTFFKYQNSGGVGPSIDGVSGGAWVNNPITGTEANFSTPVAAGPETDSIVPQYTDSTYLGTGIDNIITNRISWYDLGSGMFVQQLNNYANWLSTQIQDNNIIINIFQSPRNTHFDTNTPGENTCIATIPIRLTPGTTSGTQQYVESVGSLVGDCGTYWNKEFNPPLESLDQLTMSFTTYNGTPIPLSKILSPRVGYISNAERKTGSYYFGNTLSVYANTQFQNVMSFIFDVETYDYINQGLENPY